MTLRLIITCATLAFLALGCDQEEERLSCSDQPEPILNKPTAVPHGVVSVSDTGAFSVNNITFVPCGVNSYPLLEHAGNGRFSEINDIFDQATLLKRRLVRTNAYFEGGTNPARTRNNDGTFNEAGLVALDRLIALAAERRIRLVLTLANHWPDYGGAPAVLKMVAPNENLPVSAFYTDARAIDAQKSFLNVIVNRTNTISTKKYSQDETIFAWELINEARCTDSRYCTSETLVQWSQTMSNTIRTAGATQPIAWGGIGYDDRYGERFSAIAARAGVDIATFHMYFNVGDPLSTTERDVLAFANAAGEQGAHMIHTRAACAQKLGKAFWVEEYGWRSDNTASVDAQRATVFSHWEQETAANSVGTLPWMIGERGRPDYDGRLIRPEIMPKTVAKLTCTAELPW